MRMTLSILSHPARRNLAARRSVSLPASPVLEELVPADHEGLRTMISPGVLRFGRPISCGCSARGRPSAGIPTASDMVWEFKQLLYVSQRRVALQSVSDLSNPAIRAQLQAHIDAAGTLPAADSPDEYG